MRVVVADDSLLTREGIVQLLRAAAVEVVGQAEDADGLLREVARTTPDAAIVDIRMPPTHTNEGLVAAQRLRSGYPDVAVLILSHHIAPSYAMQLLNEYPEGVGYLLKERVFDAAVLVDALRRITDGETVVDPTIVARLVRKPRPAGALDRLSDREREVLGLIAEGLSNQAIAGELSVAERTVEAHVSHVFTKLGLVEDPTAHRRVQAVLAFLRGSS
jgi:DNA-binding NarL/FixJ family response regulator